MIFLRVIALLFCTALVVNSNLIAQHKQVNNWYFGSNNGLNFNNSPPSLIVTSPMDQLEGSAAISDENGELLFYTDGITVWNKKNQVMANGEGLSGDLSSSQSALIVPKPGSKSVFYIFTTPAWGYAEGVGMSYSVVDMQLNNGLGEVLPGQKNISLLKSATEKLAAIHHSNGRDIWVVSSEYTTNKYYAYLVTEDGVCNCPVISETGQTQYQYQGYLKFSPDGLKVVSAQAVDDVELFDFDACTGILTYFTSIPKTTGDYPFISHFYGASFSPDNSKLYLSTGWWGFYGCAKLFQYDLSAPDIAQSQIQLYDNSSSDGYSLCASDGVGALQIGPDGRIYVANWNYPYLHVINKPNEAGTQAEFIKDGVYLGGRLGQLGLPNFIESYFAAGKMVKACVREPESITPDFSYSDTCRFQQTLFVNLSGAAPERFLCYEWNFGDPNSGPDNLSDLASPAHVFSAPGEYLVTLTVRSGIDCKPYAIQKKITILPFPEVDLGADRMVCAGDSVRLEVHVPNAQYRWQDQSTNAAFTATQSGIYSVEVTLGNCTIRDSVELVFNDWLSANLGRDTVVCAGTTLTLIPSDGNQNLKYQWQDGTAASTYRVRSAGTYWVEVSDNYCTVRDTIRVTYDVPEKIDLGGEVTICLGDSYALNIPDYPNLTYRWNGQTENQKRIIENEGTYWIEYKNRGTNCLNSDTIRVYVQECLDDLHIPNVFTPNGDNWNEAFVISGGRGTTWNLKIYNRWGKAVASYENYQNNWDATGLENALYYYVLTSRYSGKSFKGWVQVLR